MISRGDWILTLISLGGKSSYAGTFRTPAFFSFLRYARLVVPSLARTNGRAVLREVPYVRPLLKVPLKGLRALPRVTDP